MPDAKREQEVRDIVEAIKLYVKPHSRVLVCSDKTQHSFPTLEKNCQLCGAKLWMDAANEPRIEELKLVLCCTPCFAVVRTMMEPREYASMVGGKTMSIADGFAEVFAYHLRWKYGR